jgi:hypothetical protein
VRPRRSIGRVEDVEDEEDRNAEAQAEAPAPATPKDLGHVDLLDTYIARDQSDRDGEVDEIEDVML